MAQSSEGTPYSANIKHVRAYNWWLGRSALSPQQDISVCVSRVCAKASKQAHTASINRVYLGAFLALVCSLLGLSCFPPRMLE